MIDLQEHILLNAGSIQISKGYEIAQNQLLVNETLDLEKRTASFRYGSGRKSLNVSVEFRKDHIVTYCECNKQYMFTMCEHEVAATLVAGGMLGIVDLEELGADYVLKNLFFPEKKNKTPRPGVKEETRQRTNTQQPFEIVPFDDLQEFFKKAKRPSIRSHYGSDVQDEENHFANNEFKFHVREQMYGKPNTVRLFAKTGKWFVTCNCNTFVPHLCAHEYILFEKIVNTWDIPDLLNFEPILAGGRQEAMKDYNIPLSEVDKYVVFGFRNGSFYRKPREAGLFGNAARERAFERLSGIRGLQQRLKTDLPKQSVAEERRGYALVFFKEADDVVAVISGKLNKKGELATHFRTEYHLDLPPEWKHVTEWLRHLTGMQPKGETEFAYGYNESTDLARSQAALTKAREFLQTVPILLSDFTHRLSRNSVTPLTLASAYARIEIDVTENNEYFFFKPLLVLGSQRVPIENSPALMYRPGWIIYEEQVYLYPSLEFDDLLMYFLGYGQVRYVKSMRDEFLAHLQELSKSVKINFNIPVEQEQVTVQPQSSRIYLYEEQGQIVFLPKVFYGEGIEFPVLQSLEEFHLTSDKVVSYTRDVGYEKAFLHSLGEQIPELDIERHQDFLYLPVETVSNKRWFYRFIEWAAGKQVEIFGQNNLPSLKYSTTVPSVSMQLKTGIDWFSAHVEMHFDAEKISLAQLKRVLNQGEDFIRLKDGSLGLIPDEWRKKLETIFRVGNVNQDEIRISKLHFMLIDELFDALDEEEIRVEIEEKKQKLKSFSTISKAQLPLSITADLRPYQKDGFHWLSFLHEYGFGGCLADDMGLGKTVQVLSAIASAVEGGAGTSLIVVPRSLLFNWENEITKFCPTLKYLLHHGMQRWKSGKEMEQYDVVISTYGTVMRDIDAIRKITFEYVVLDESQAIKNPESKTYKAVRLLQAKHRLVMTGTPVENNTFDLYAQMSFVNPGLLGPSKAFLDNYVKPIDQKQDTEIARELQRIIHPFVLRRTKEQVAPELPSRSIQFLYCEMQPAQRELYELYRKKYARELDEIIEKQGLNKSKFYVIEGLTRLRQICNAPELVSKEHAKAGSEKLDVLIEQLTNVVTHHKALVFSQFTQMLKLIEKRLETAGIKYYYLDGQTTDRKTIVEEFQSVTDKCVFLISLKAGGTGLNLTSAEYVYIVDPWWNPAAEQQAIDRTHRIGQDKPVIAYKLICKDSIEEKIVMLQARKKQIAEDLIQTEESVFKSLTQEDIAHLFGV